MYSYGNISIYIINLIIALAQFGFIIIFFIVFGDVAGNMLQRVGLEETSFWTSRLCTQSLLALVLFYLILRKEIHQLKYAGLIVLCLGSIFMVLFSLHYLTSDIRPEKKANMLKLNFDIKFFASLPTMITSYVFHTTFVSTFSHLKNQSERRGLFSDFLAKIGIFIIFLITPLVAFGLYGDNIEKNLLQSVAGETGTLPVILESFFLMIPALTIPIIFFIGKEAILIIFDEITRKSYSKQNKIFDDHHAEKNRVALEIENNRAAEAELEGGMPEIQNSVIRNFGNQEDSKNDDIERPNFKTVEITTNEIKDNKIVEINSKEYLNMKPAYYYIITIICYVMVVIISITVQDVHIFFGLIGATAGTYIMWIGPGSFYVIAIHKKNIKLETKFEKFVYISAWIYLIFGIIS